MRGAGQHGTVKPGRSEQTAPVRNNSVQIRRAHATREDIEALAHPKNRTEGVGGRIRHGALPANTPHVPAVAPSRAMMVSAVNCVPGAPLVAFPECVSGGAAHEYTHPIHTPCSQGPSGARPRIRRPSQYSPYHPKARPHSP